MRIKCDCCRDSVVYFQPVQGRIADNTRLLEQGAALISSLSHEDFAAASPLGASVGAHFRHIIDFYGCFLRGLASATIDYDQRDRDPHIESSQEVCKQAILDIRSRLLALDLSAAAPLLVRAEAASPAVYAPSSVGRELQFLVAHTVHHFALISYVLIERGKTVPQGFGVASSTLEHLRTESLAG